jgi:sulfur carrier protein
MERYDAAMSHSTPFESPGAEIQVNGEPTRVPDGCTIAQLLAGRDLGGKRVAVAVDREVVPRSSWARFTLKPGARVEILEAVGGG